VKTNVFIGKFVDQAFNVAGRVRDCAPIENY